MLNLRRRALWLWWSSAFLLAALAWGALPSLAQPFDISPEEERLAELTNSARSDAGLPPLRLAPELMRSAETKARDMQQRGYFSHNSPEGTSPFTLMRQAGADFSTAGENIGQGASVDRVFAAWMKSAEHRQNILSPDYTHLGTGVTVQGGRVTAVQHFARLRTPGKDYLPAPATPAPSAPPPATQPAPAPAPAPGPGTYVVQPGDTLASIAQRAGVPAWRLIIENGWSALGELRPGQVIRIPQ